MIGGAIPLFQFQINVMSYIILETLGGAEYAVIVTDEQGNNLVFDERTDAEAEAAGCQDALIVEV